jgi:hypothetical protein
LRKKLRFGKPLQSAKQSVTNPFVGKYIDYAWGLTNTLVPFIIIAMRK